MRVPTVLRKSTCRAARRLAAEQRGFTLIELLVSVMIGLVVVTAAFNLLDASTRASAEVQDRVDATQRGRVAMEQVTQVLRSQVCLNTNTPALVYGDDNELRFYAELGDEVFTPEARRLRFEQSGADLNAGRLTEAVWTTLANPPANTFAATPTRTRNVLTEMARVKPLTGNAVPVFRYYAFIGNDPATPALLLQTPLSAADRARVVKIAVQFDSRPGKRGKAANRFDTTFENDVFVRTADPTDPEHSPQCL